MLNEATTGFHYLIGICGKARSGKDTVAHYLRDRFSFHHASFAAKLKEVTQDLFDLSDSQINGNLKEVVDARYDKTPRWLLQHLGTNVFRELYPQVWVDSLFRSLPPWEQRIVISDVRFPNEIDAIREKGGTLWKVERHGHEGASGGIESHPSETSLDRIPNDAYDAVLSAGDGELALLYRQAEEAFAKMVSKESIP